MKKKIVSLLLAAVMCFSTCGVLAGCSQEKTDTFVIMTQNLDGLFNPFVSTSATDGTIVAMTQIGMLTSKLNADGDAVPAYGDDEAVVVKDCQWLYDKDLDETVYTFVLKNGILYSDGHPLTMEDVLFNLYVYLDPVYTGSATLYSTDIQGLLAYRTQEVNAGDSSDSDDQIASTSLKMGQARLNELINLFRSTGATSQDGVYNAGYDKMKAAILASNVSSGYKSAITNDPAEYTADEWRQMLLKDYEHALAEFRKELESDYEAAQESYTENPYKARDEFKDPVLCFMYTEGYVEIEWAEGADGKADKSKIQNVTKLYNDAVGASKETAIDYVYNDQISRNLNVILSYWATANTLLTEFAAKAKEVILHANMSDDGNLAVKNISGIVSLGHNAETKGTTVTVNGTDYKVASEHNADGTVKNEGEYDVLQITINGVDPKAIWNFAFSVAPQHYYGEGSSVGVDIENNKFGVEFGTFDFMTKIIQSNRNIKLPMGAGAYKVTNRANSDTPTGSEFYSDNVVYFKANNYFETVGSGINNAKIEKVRYQVVSTSNAIAALENGSVHYITPQLTPENYEALEKMETKGYNTLLSDQLGYGYIGINASKIPDINIRKAIMCAMNTTLALDYYRPGTAQQIYYPMSVVSWAYPKDGNGTPLKDNGKDYPQINGRFNEETARDNIEKYMQEAGVSAGDPSLKVTFTIAGSNLQDHPTYKTFRDAAALLNDMGWDVEVVPDVQALTKINTGSLEVWAAAWGSTIDPDLYQVYHKNSTATSTKAWGYASIKNSGTAEEQEILDNLSDLIEQARETLDQDERTALYKKAMDEILNLAIELPVYQRSELYAFNANVIAASSLPAQNEMNPYTSPLDRIWEIEFAE